MVGLPAQNPHFAPSCGLHTQLSTPICPHLPIHRVLLVGPLKRVDRIARAPACRVQHAEARAEARVSGLEPNGHTQQRLQGGRWYVVYLIYDCQTRKAASKADTIPIWAKRATSSLAPVSLSLTQDEEDKGCILLHRQMRMTFGYPHRMKGRAMSFRCSAFIREEATSLSPRLPLERFLLC